MAKQTGNIKIVGTVDEICFYQMEGEYFARQKSSLSGRRFWKDKVFEGSRKSCGLLAKASPLASRLYHTLPKEQKSREMFRTLAGKVKLFLKAGWTEEEIRVWFLETYLPDREKSKKNALRKRASLPSSTLPFLRVVPKLVVIPSFPVLGRKMRSRFYFRGTAFARMVSTCLLFSAKIYNSSPVNLFSSS